MGLTVPHRTPDGRLAEIDTDVLGVDQKLRDIDPYLCLAFDYETEQFEVWHSGDGTCAPYRVACAPFCDQRLVDLVNERDRKRVDVLAVIDAHNAKVQLDRQRRFDEWHAEEFAPRFQHAIKRDLAQHLGGRL